MAAWWRQLELGGSESPGEWKPVDIGSLDGVGDRGEWKPNGSGSLQGVGAWDDKKTKDMDKMSRI